MSNKVYHKTKSGKILKSALGTCRSRNIIYAATCQICSKDYIGKSTPFLLYRNNGYRAKFIKYGNQKKKGIHLHDEHKIMKQV